MKEKKEKEKVYCQVIDPFVSGKKHVILVSQFRGMLMSSIIDIPLDYPKKRFKMETTVDSFT